MMRCLLIAASLLAAMPAMAQDAGSAAPVPPPAPDARSMQYLANYANCLVEKRPKIVRSILSMDFRTEEYGKALLDLGDGPNNCMDRDIRRARFNGLPFAAALAEGVIRRDYAGRPLRTLIPADWTARPIEARNEAEQTALCLVQRSPDAVGALLASPPMSDGANAAVAAMAPALPGCVAGGGKVRLTRPFLRAVLATATLRAITHFNPQGAM